MRVIVFNLILGAGRIQFEIVALISYSILPKPGIGKKGGSLSDFAVLSDHSIVTVGTGNFLPTFPLGIIGAIFSF